MNRNSNKSSIVTTLVVALVAVNKPSKYNQGANKE